MADSLLGPPISKPTLLLFHTPRISFPLNATSKSNSKPNLDSLLLPLSMASVSTTVSQYACSSNSISVPRPAQPSLLVFSGGTAFNGVVEELKQLTTRVAHVLPVSDDGGSTAEIVRVLGGPAVGDIRSRCLRLSDQSSAEALAVRRLLGHRLPLDAHQAKSEWYSIVEGEHPLWKGVSRPYRETIQAFLVYFQNEILRRPNESFCFCNGSIGNFFFAGARIFFQSLDAAIFLFSRVSDIPPESMVLPVISTNDRLTLGCELSDGTIIRGQNEISHPSQGYMQPIDKACSSAPALNSRIKRVFYMSSEGGSSLHEVLRGVGEIISSRTCPKVLLLNGTHDRETSDFSASCFVTAITDALNRKYGDPHNSVENHPSQYVNTILVPKGGKIPIDVQCLASQGVYDVTVIDSFHDPKAGILFNPKSLISALGDLIGRNLSAKML